MTDEEKAIIEQAARVCESRAESLRAGQQYIEANEAEKCAWAIRRMAENRQG